MPRLTAAPRKKILGVLAKTVLLFDDRNAVENARPEVGTIIRRLGFMMMDV
jgi:hypothetical protein